MSPTQVEDIMHRIHGMWPKMANDDTDREWLRFMRLLEHSTADRAVDELRDTLGWPPSIADFRAAYRLAAERKDTPQLHGRADADVFTDTYGYDQKHWVYCWKCDMAIPIEDQYLHDPDRGLFHPKPCPKPGEAPLMPVGERMERREQFKRRGIE